jgi:hypothetical protein
LAIERTLVQIRERSYFDQLDLALVVLRRKPLPLGLAALAGVAPWAAFNAWLLSLPSFLPAWLIVLWVLEIPWATAPLTIVLGGMMFGERPSIRRILGTLLRAFWPMMLYQGLLRGVMVLITVLSFLIPARLAFLNEVILLERGPWGRAFSRCSSLCGDRGTELFGRCLAQLLFMALFVTGFRWGVEVLHDTLISSWSWGWSSVEDPFEAASVWLFNWTGAVAQVGFWVAVSFFGVARFFGYIDQRIRMEGWEVELRLRTVGAAMEEAERW